MNFSYFFSAFFLCMSLDYLIMALVDGVLNLFYPLVSGNVLKVRIYRSGYYGR